MTATIFTNLVISLASYNTAEITLNTVTAILEHSPENSILIVVDNGSKDNSVDRLREINDCRLIIIALESNLGFSGAHNLVFARFDSEYFLCINSDVRIASATISDLITGLNRSEQLAVCGPRVVGPDGALQSTARKVLRPRVVGLAASVLALYWPNVRNIVPGRIQRILDTDALPPETGEVEWLDGMCLMFQSNAFREVGGFDESYFFDHEVGDLMARIKAKKYIAYYLSSTEVEHQSGSSRKFLKGLDQISRLGYFRYLKRNFPFEFALVLPIFIGLSITTDIFRHQPSRPFASTKQLIREFFFGSKRMLLKEKPNDT